jgi:3-hydroxybutyrate dehydrogenase
MHAGKTAIVTGSTSGIGLGIATALAGAGTNIVLNGFGAEDEIDKIVSDLKRQHNVGVMYSDANIAEPDEICEMIEQTRAEFGGVDILVNIAGFNMWRRSKNFRSRSGMRLSPSIYPARFTPAGWLCPT